MSNASRNVTFACPECGTPIVLPPHAAGRKLRCEECLTLVEVPYFRREHTRRRASNARQWAWVAIVAASAVIATMLISMIVSARDRADKRRVFDQLVAEAAGDERAGDFDNALRRLAAAANLSRTPGAVPAERLAAARASEERVTLLKQQRDSSQRVRAAEADLTVANSIAGESKPDWERVLNLCEQAHETASLATQEDGGTLTEQARALAASVIRSRGVVLAPTTGQFLFQGSGRDYDERFAPALEQTFKARGFVPKRAGKVFSKEWDRLAPFRFNMNVNEALGPTYLNSPLRTTRIDADLRLSAPAGELWHVRVTARTRVSSSRMSAFQSGYLATARKRDPEMESRLRDDALAEAVELLPGKLTSFPAWSPGTLSTPGQ